MIARLVFVTAACADVGFESSQRQPGPHTNFEKLENVPKHAWTPALDVKKVHMVWMNHLDMGYTNTIASVVNIYFHEYFQRAVDTAEAVNRPGQAEMFKYTSHAFLIDLFLNCPTRLGLHCDEPDADDDVAYEGPSPNFHSHCVICPNTTEISMVKEAIQSGVITWHAFPANCEPELADASLFESGLMSVHALDDMFSVKRKTVISQRDVPGVSRSVIPLMRKHNVLAFSEGVNGQIQPPSLPPIFNWTDPLSGESIIVLLHPRGYGFGTNGHNKDKSNNSVAQASELHVESHVNAMSHVLWAAEMMSDPLIRAHYDADDLGLGGTDMCPNMSDVVTVEGFDESLVYLVCSEWQSA